MHTEPRCRWCPISARGLTLVEVLIAGVILLVALPPLIESALTVLRVDAAREERTHATDLQQLVLERARHRLYDGDDRGYHLNDSQRVRQIEYNRRPPSWKRAQEAMAERSAPVFRRGVPASQYVAPLFAPDGGNGPYLTAATHPELVRELSDYELEVRVVHHLDDLQHPDRELAAKRPDEPKLDLARFTVTVRWRDRHGRDRSQALDTRATRPLYETDAAMSGSAR